MANIDDSTQTPPGYWFGVIEGRLHERMRAALADQGLRRGSWRILHTLAEGPATAGELAARLPHGDRPGRPGRPEGMRGRGAHPGWRSQEPRDEQAYASADSHRSEADHGDHHGFAADFERGYVSGFDRGFTIGSLRAHPFPPFPGAHGPFPGGHGYGPFPGSHGYGPGGHGYPHAYGPRGPFGADRRHGRRRGHRIDRVLGDFVERGWVWFDGERATLTDEGRAAHDRAFERVRAVREELADGIPAEDYGTTMATLEAMARNLGWRPAPAPGAAPDGEPNMDA